MLLPTIKSMPTLEGYDLSKYVLNILATCVHVNADATKLTINPVCQDLSRVEDHGAKVKKAARLLKQIGVIKQYDTVAQPIPGGFRTPPRHIHKIRAEFDLAWIEEAIKDIEKPSWRLPKSDPKMSYKSIERLSIDAKIHIHQNRGMYDMTLLEYSRNREEIVFLPKEFLHQTQYRIWLEQATKVLNEFPNLWLEAITGIPAPNFPDRIHISPGFNMGLSSGHIKEKFRYALENKAWAEYLVKVYPMVEESLKKESGSQYKAEVMTAFINWMADKAPLLLNHDKVAIRSLAEDFLKLDCNLPYDKEELAKVLESLL